MKGFTMPDSEVIVTFTDWLLKATVDISFCVLLILLVRRFFTRFFGARLCRILWLVLFIRCFIPWSLPVNIYPASLLPEFSTFFNSRSSPTSLNKSSEKITVLTKVVPNEEIIPEHQAVANHRIFTPETIRIIFIGIWFIGSLTLLSITLFRNRRIAHYATETPKPVPSWLQEIFLDCRQRMKIKIWPVLIVTSDIDSPGLIGAIRPRILLPYDLVNNSNRQQFHHILLHELAHIKQGDIWLSWFWTLVCSLQWFNPLVWLAGKYMYLDREMACDERVLKMLESEKRIEYSRSILDLFRKVNLPAATVREHGGTAPCPGLACVVERKTNIERRLGMIMKFKIRSNRQIVLGALSLLIIAAFSLVSFAGSGQTAKPSKEKAELMGRVEDFFMHNFRDVTARKSIEWGEPETDEKGNRSIRYMCETQIWEKDWKIMNAVFTFDKDGEYVNYKNVSGYPKDKIAVKIDTTTDEGMKALVEKFFSQNYRDITARKTIEWGEVGTYENGNRGIRYKYEATIRDKDKIISDKIFTFTPEGKFVSAIDVEETKWQEGRAGAGMIATQLRAYVAENLPNVDYKNITFEKLGFTRNDLRGKYFNMDNYKLTSVSFDESRADNPLQYTITVNRPDDSWKIKSMTLTQTGQWIQNN
jgi:beta-lactamase regulating signal transducer with metallopeptidase domain